MSSSSSRMMWEIDQQEEELFNQYEGMFNLQIAENEMEEDEERRRRDDETRMARASHSRRVIQTVAQICRPNRSRNLDRSRQRRGEELLDDYFVHNSAFPDTYFRRCFRMERHLFNRIMTDVCNHDSYFMQKKDACGVMGLLPEQKITAALRMLAYGASADQVDEIKRMGKSIILEALMRFCGAVESLYMEKHFASYQEGCRKDVERCFGILQARWAIVRGAARMFDVESLQSIMMTCVILHNMIVEDEFDYDAVDEYKLEPDTMNNSRTLIYCAHDATEEPVQHEPLERDERYNERVIQRYTALQRSSMHNDRQIDLIEHQWALKQAEDT